MVSRKILDGGTKFLGELVSCEFHRLLSLLILQRPHGALVPHVQGEGVERDPVTFMSSPFNTFDMKISLMHGQGAISSFSSLCCSRLSVEHRFDISRASLLLKRFYFIEV